MIKIRMPNFIQKILIFYKYIGSKFLALILFALMASILEGIGILMLIPFFENISKLNNPESSFDVSLPFFDEAIFQSINLVEFFGIFTLIFLLKGVFVFFLHYASTKIKTQLFQSLKIDLINAFISMDISHYDKKNIGHLTNISTEQVENATSALDAVVKSIVHFFNVLIYFSFAVSVDWFFSLILVFVGALLAPGFNKINSYIYQISGQLTLKNSTLISYYLDILKNFKYLKATSNLSFYREKVSRAVSKIVSGKIKIGMANAITDSIKEPITVIVISTVVLIQSFYFGSSLANIVVVVILFHRSLSFLIGIQSKWQSALAKIPAINVIEEEKRQILSRISNRIIIKEEIDFNGDIVLEKVNFSRKESSFKIEDLSLKIPQNKITALVGKSGSGKTTISEFILGFLYPSNGKVMFGDVDLKAISENSLGNSIGFIPQNPTIFSGTVLENILMKDVENFVNNNSANVDRAVDLAGIRELINSLPDGLNTVIGGGGIELSGGEKQRLMIAREIYRKPKILVLDEATSSLDQKTTSYIKRSLKELSNNMSILMITHDHNSLDIADYIYLIDQGKIVDHGTNSKKVIEKFNKSIR